MLELSANETGIIIDALQAWFEAPEDGSVKTSIIGAMMAPNEEKSKEVFDRANNKAIVESEKRKQKAEELRHRITSNALLTSDVPSLITALNCWVGQPHRVNMSMDMILAVLTKKEPNKDIHRKIDMQCEERDEIATMIKTKLYLWRAK